MNKAIMFLVFWCLGSSLIWVQTNGQFLWSSFAKNPFMLSLVFGTLISYIMIMATKYGFSVLNGSLWSIKFVGFVINNNNNTILEIEKKNNRCDCLHRVYEKAQQKRNKIKKKKIFKMKNSTLPVEIGTVYPEGTNMKELVNNFIVEFKLLKEREKHFEDYVIDYEDFLKKDYRNNYLK